MIINGLPITEYHNSVPAFLSKTSIKNYIANGATWWKLAYLDRSIEIPEPSGALVGLALDCWLTEGPEKFGREWAVKPHGLKLSTREGREWGDAQEGKRILPADDFAILLDAVQAVTTHKVWPQIEQSQAQVTIRRQSQSLGLGLQSRPDWLGKDRTVLYDLKKTNDLDRFGKQAIDLGYHLQAAIAGWCLAGEGIGLEHAYLVAVEWQRGARCRVYEIPHEALEAGDKLMRETAAEIADRLARNDWVDRQVTDEYLPIPEWMQRQIERAIA